MLGIARVDRYLGAGFLKMFFTVLLVLVALVIGLEFQRIVGDMADSFASFPWSEVAAYLALTLPEQFAMLIPIAALAAAGISLSGLARAGEITALKASGIGPIRIAAPVLVITAVVCLFYGLAQETIVPAAAREARLLRDHLRGRSSAGVMDTGRRWIVGEDGRLWAYLDWDERAGAILAPGLFAVDLEEARLLERVEASEAIRSGQSWDFRNGWRRSFADDTGGDFERFEGFVSRASEDAEIFGANRDRLIFGRALADQLTIKDLWAHVDRMSRAGYDASALRVSLYQKFVTPLVAVALLLVGVPLVVSGWARKGSLFGLGVSLLITTAFWALWAVSTSLGREGVLSPPLAAFLPIVLLASAGVTLLGRAR
ncbi:MAG: YjgP/YjgQ family permease [Acidobacteria bacterium]|nr:YjgP/YjgQ family permease [Acidobacteriota bacterium]